MQINSSLHTDFKLDGVFFNHKIDLLEFTFKKFPDIYIFLKHWFDDSEFITVKTSGSTGSPKLIKLKKEFMINSAKATGQYFNLQQKTTALLCLPIDFIAGKMMLIRALTLGWHLDVGLSNTNPLEGVKKHYDFLAMVPMQLFHSLKKLEHIKKLIVGGGLVSNELAKKLNNVSTQIFATYGMTETVTHIAVKPLNRAGGLTSTTDLFQTLPSVKISKDDRNCLCIDAPSVADKTINTNDLVEILSSNKFKWLGRYDNIINSGGVKLIPEQIESRLHKIILQRFFVIGFPDRVLGEKLILICEGNKKADLLDKIIRFQKENPSDLAKFEIPKKIYFVNKFLETETKKIKRMEVLNSIHVV